MSLSFLDIAKFANDSYRDSYLDFKNINQSYCLNARISPAIGT